MQDSKPLPPPRPPLLGRLVPSYDHLLPEEDMPLMSPKERAAVTPRRERKAFENSRRVHRGRIIDEIIETEESFLNQISLVNSLYRAPLAEANILPKSKIDHLLFPGLMGLIAIHQNLLDALKECVQKVKQSYLAEIADVFLDFRDFMKVHSDYAPKHATASAVSIS